MSSRREHLLVCAVLLALIASLSVLVLPMPIAGGAVRSPFSAVYTADDNGAIAVTGNSQMRCNAAVSGCTNARSGTGANINNNNYVMGFIDTDAVSTTTNSTSADVALPAGSEVLYARLIWGGRLIAGGSGQAGSGAPGTAKFRAPGAAAYTTVTASSVYRPGLTGATDADPYQAALDVTATVRAAGNGTYWFADLVAATGTDRFGGWSLIVAYRNPSLPLRNLTVFEGYADITTESVANSSVTATVSGFLTPAAGTVNATVGLVAWEGDLGTTGDILKFNNTTLSDAQRPSTNTFDSRISNFGTSITDRNPNYLNNFGVDMGRVSANGVLANGQTSADVTVSTTGDYIYLGALTTEIDLYTPSFVGVSKSVVNLNGNSPAKVGDTLEYRLAFTNSGQDFADNVVVRDVVPANVSYVPGSLTVASGANGGAKTDAVGDDQGEYVGADRLIRVRLGTGATAAAGGTLAVNASTAVTFRVTLDRPSAGSTVTNGSFLDYRARTLQRSYTFTTNTVSTAVQEIADLAITKASTPPGQTAGSNVTYTLAVSNAGPNAGANVVTTDTLPAGTSFVSASPPTGTSCAASGQAVTCRTASLAVGATLTIPIVAAIAPGTAAGSLVNAATVTADTADDVPSNNTATATTGVTRNADLGLTKTGPGSVVAGGSITYTLTVRNAGASTATATSVTDTLPVGLALTATNPSQGSCTANGQQTVICALGTLNPGASATVELTGTVAASFTGASLTNQAVVSSSTPDGNDANNTASLTVPVTRDADLAVTKVVNPTTAVAGGTITYLITVANSGRSDATGVTLADTVPVAVPGGITVLSATTTQGSCSTTAAAVSCALGTLTPGTSARVSVAARIAPETPAGTLTNTAVAATTTPEAVTANNRGSVDLAVQSQADLSVVKSATPNPVVPGAPLTYTLQVSNAGPSRATGVTLVDTLPAGTAFVSGTGCTAAGQTVTCTVGTLDSGSSATRTLVVSTPDTIPGGTLTNTVRAVSDNDPVSSNNTASFVSSTNPSADLSLTKATTPSPLVAGQNATYTLTARNNGPSAATGVSVVDDLPTGVSYVSATAAGGGGGTCTNAGQRVTCDLAGVSSGATVTITIVGAVAPGTTARTLSNTATISAATPTDPTLSNNTATSVAEVARSADVAVTLTAITPTVRAGEEATYEVVIRNNGPSTALNVIVTGQVPAGMVPVAGSSGGACSVTGRTVSCPADPTANPLNLPPGAQVTLRFRALVLPSTPAGPISGTAFIGATTPDPNQANNSDPETITVTTAADLVTAKAASPTTFVAGGQGVYTLTATNRGPSDATQVVLADTIPTGLTVVSVDPTAGSCSLTGQAVACTLDRLAPDGVMTVRIRVTVPTGATGQMTNTVNVTSAVSDPNEQNNSTTVATPISQSADLRLSKTAAPDPVLAGTSVSYTLTAVNAGPSNATAVVLTDELPAGLTVLPSGIAAPAGVTCTLNGTASEISCAFGDLAVGDSRTVTVSAFVPGDTDAGTRLTNSATLTSPTPTQNPDDRSSRVTSTVDTSADLSVTKTAQSASPIAGATETYVLTVVNNGPSLARDVDLTDALPAAARFMSAVNPLGSCRVTDGDRGVSCSLGDLTLGEIATVRITVAITATAAGQQLTDVAQVSSDTPDPRDDNDKAALTQPVSGQNDLDLTKSVVDGPVVAGADVTYRLSVTNNGPSQARLVNVVDVLPDQLTFISASASDGGGCQYEPLPQTPADDDQVRCNWGQLDVGDSRTATLTFAVPQGFTGQLTNTATATSSATDPTPAQATAGPTPVTTSADLSATKALLSGAPIAGEEVRWQVTVRNAGPSVARAVELTDNAPDGVRFTGADVVQTGDCRVSDDTVGCDLGDLAAGAVVTVTVNGELADDYVGEDLVNTAVVGSDTSDPDPDNNTAVARTPVGALADLTLIKTVDPAAPVAGSDVTWTVRVSNAGPSTATRVVLTDVLPAGVALDSATLDVAGTCENGDQITCTVPTLAPGATATLTVVAGIDAGYSGTTVANTASVRSSVADPDPLDNTDTATALVARSADLSLTKTGPAAVVAGEQLAWQLTVTNTGPSDAADVVVTDDLPEGVTGVSGTVDGGGACTVNEGAVTCSVGVLRADSSTVVTVTGTLDPASTVNEITNNASVTSPTPDPDTADRRASATTEVTRSAGLTITKEATTEAFVAGQPIGWLITVQNAGPSLARDVVITDQLPAGVDAAASSTPGCAVTGRTLTCAVANLAPGTSVSVVVTGVLASNYAADTLDNTAAVASSTPTPAGGDTSTSRTPVLTSADLAVGKVITSGPPVAGDTITFRVVVRNSGPSDASDVVMVDEVPEGISQLTADPEGGTCTISGSTVRCALGVLPTGDQTAITIAGVLSQDVGDEITNTATASSTTNDPDPDDNTSSATTTVGESAAVGVSKTGPVTADAGSRVTWTVTVTNDGPSVARSVTVDDPVPDGVDEVTVDAPAGVECTGEVGCTLGDLDPDESVVLTLSGRIDPAYARAVLTNKATVTSATPDPDSTDATATSSTVITRSADLSVTKSAEPSALTPGRDATYTVTVSNAGPSAATALTVTDVLPDGLSLRGSGPSADSGDCDVVGRTVTCTVAALAAGAETTVEIPVTLDASFTGSSIANSASVTSATPDPDSDDTSTTLTSPVAGRADLTLEKSGPAEVVAGTPLAWRLQLSNAGPSDAQSVVITDQLPAGVGAVFAAATQGTCTQDGRTVTCRVGVLAAGARVTVDLGTVGVLDPSFDPGTITNAATVTSPTPEDGDGDGGGDDGRRSAATTDVLVSADVAVVKTPLSSTAVAGGPVAWRVTVVNNGPSTARDVVLTDPDVDGLRDLGIDPPDGVTCTAARCTVDSLEPGIDGALVFTVTATLAADYTEDTVVNTAIVEAATDDTDPGNNRSSQPIVVARSTGLSVTKVSDEDPATPGEEVSWTIRVRNAGPSRATGVTITDPLPAGVTGVEIDPPDGVDCELGTVVACDVGSMGVGPDADVVVTVTATLDAGFTGRTLSNTVTVSSASPDPDLTDNASTATTQVQGSADLTVTKTGPATVRPGEPISWLITVANSEGPSTARNVVISDAVPAGVTQVSATPDGETGTDCQVAGSTMTCAIDSLPVGARIRITVAGVVEANLAAGSLSNVATVDAATADPEPANNISEPVITQVTPAAGLSIVKTVTPDPLEAGAQATFTLTVRNAGPSTARAVTVTDQVPAGMTIGRVATPVGTCTVTDQRVSCALGDLGPTADPVAITVAVSVSPDADSYVNAASVLSETFDPVLDDNISQVSGAAAAAADLTVTKRVVGDLATISPGTSASWSIAVTNDGPATARDVLVVDQVPTTATITSVNSRQATCDQAGTRPLTCRIAALAVGQTVTIELDGTVSADATGSVTNTVAATSTTTADSDLSNNTASVTTPLDADADVTLTKTSSTDIVTAGGEISWTLTIANNGPATARDVVVTDPLPSGVVAAAPQGCDLAERAVRCVLGTLAPRTTQTILIKGQVSPAATGSIVNTAVVSSTTPDSQPANNADSATAAVAAAADLSVVKFIDNSAPRVGDIVRYTMTVANDGPSTADGVVSTERWPRAVDLISVDSSRGTYDPSTGRWKVGELPATETASLTLTGRVLTEGTITNTVVVAALTTDPDPANNRGDVSVTATEFSLPIRPHPKPASGGNSAAARHTSLPNTGGPSIMLLAIGLVALTAGARLLRRGRR